MTQAAKPESTVYLEALQKSILSAGSANPAVLRMRFRQANVFNADDIQYHVRFPLTDHERIKFNLESGLFTSLEDDTTKRILWFLMNRSKTAFSIISRPLPEDIVLGTLPLGKVNACIFNAPSSGTIIAINSGLFSFLAAICEVVMSCTIPEFHNGQTACRFPRADEVQGFLSQETETSNRFIRIFQQYYLAGSSDGESGYISADSERGTLPFTTMLIQTACMFVVCHELSHLILGHLGAKEQKCSVNEDAIPEAWLKEHLCDALASSAILSYNRRFVESDIEAAFLGVGIFFFAIELLGRLNSTQACSTHPPAMLRLKVLVDRLTEEAGERFAGTDIEKIQVLMAALWERNEYKLREELANPKTPEWYFTPLMLLNPALRQHISTQFCWKPEEQSIIDELLPQRILD